MVEYVNESIDEDISILNEDGRVGVANLEYDLYHGSKKTATAAAVGAGALVGKGVQYAGRFARSYTIKKEIKKQEANLKKEIDVWLGIDHGGNNSNQAEEFAKVINQSFEIIKKKGDAIKNNTTLSNDAKAQQLTQHMNNSVEQFSNEYKKFLMGFDTKLRANVTTSTQAIIALIDKGGFFALKSIKTKTKLIRSWNNVMERVNLHAAKQMRSVMESKIIPLVPSGYDDIEAVLKKIPGSYFTNEDLKKIQSYISVHLKDKDQTGNNTDGVSQTAGANVEALKNLINLLNKIVLTLPTPPEPLPLPPIPPTPTPTPTPAP